MSTPEETAPRPPRPWVGWLSFLAAMAAVFVLGTLFASVLERRQESKIQPPLQPVGAFETDSAKWGVNWPREYSSYKMMADDSTRTKYGGSFPRDYLEETPANVIMFSGYGFAREYRQARGHTYAIEDVTRTKRLDDKTPGTCWTCKGPDVPRLMASLGAAKMGKQPTEGPLMEFALAGAAEFYGQKFDHWKGEITHPIACLDCHDPQTMRLRISRPALVEAFKRQGRDIEAVSHQEMRSLVCAQCHVEYYFKGDGKYLTFPWDKGTTADAIEAYYDNNQFSDWTHAISKTPMVKIQHPDFEVYSTGIHAYRQVACADCHMPYRTEGGVKYTDHQVRSPLLAVENSCQVCHRWSESDIVKRVEATQDKVHESRGRTEQALARAHFDIAACMQAGATDDELKPLRDLVRHAQLRWDYVAANNGMGFHSPAECLRVLNSSVDMAQQTRVAAARVLAAHGQPGEVKYPDFTSKDKAQAIDKGWIEGTTLTLIGGKDGTL